MARRYASFGGLEAAAGRCFAGELSFKSIAKALRISPTTVREDISSVVGPTEMANFLLRQRELNATRTMGQGMNRAEALNFLSTGQGLYDEKQRRVVAHVVETLSGRGVEAFWASGGHLAAYSGPSGRGSLRIGFPNPRSQEFKMGMQRFSIPSKKGPAPHIFVVISPEGAEFYYFLTQSEIGTLKTINLRFRDREAPFKYTHSLSRWSIIISPHGA